jgi:hypothetical protein
VAAIGGHRIHDSEAPVVTRCEKLTLITCSAVGLGQWLCLTRNEVVASRVPSREQKFGIPLRSSSEIVWPHRADLGSGAVSAVAGTGPH